MDSVPQTLRQWALIADSIAELHCNHEQRLKRISSFLGIVQDYQHFNRPVWQQTLINLLKQSMNRRLNYSHSEVRTLLILFGDVCQHVASNYDEWWLAWAQTGDRDAPKAKQNEDSPDPFKNFFDALEDEDEDDTKS